MSHAALLTNGPRSGGFGLVLATLGAACVAAHAVEVNIQPPVDVEGFGWETHMAANPCDRDHAVGVWISYRPPHPYGLPDPPPMASTTDGGQQWTMRSFMNFAILGDPSVAFHPFGDHAYNGAMKAGCPGGVGGGTKNGVRRVSDSTVSGVSFVFEAPPCSDCTPFCVDRTSIASGPSSEPASNIVYLYFAFVDGLSIAFTRAEALSELNDTEWVAQTAWLEPYVELSAPSETFSMIPILGVGPDRAVHCVYVRDFPRPAAIMHTFSTGDGAPGTWLDPPTIVSDQGTPYKPDLKVGGKFRVFQMPGIAADPREDADIMYVSYTAHESGDAEDLNIYVSKGLPDGMGNYAWQPRVLVTPPLTDPAGCAQGQELDQFFSAITVDERGWVHVIWQEACDTGDFVQPDVYTGYAYSTDGGQSFTRMRLDPAPLVPGPGATFIGDYLGLSSVGNRVYALYPNGPVHLGYGDFTIYSTRIDIGVNEADFNGDCVVDLNDFNTFALCFTGSGNIPDPGCFMCNLADSDCDVDLNDFNAFSQLFGSSGCPGGEGAAAGGALPPDPGALAVWTVGHLPGPARETFAGRCRDLASRTADQTQAAVLEAFAAAIAP